jgi:hypothetical protein
MSVRARVQPGLYVSPGKPRMALHVLLEPRF